jgi:3-methyladenine DNA glycosylase/8-oxoguanine DNA glycosylase
MAFRQGRYDPTFAVVDGCVWRASLTPDGPGSVCIEQPLSQKPLCIPFGPGGEWLASRSLGLLGLDDVIPTIHPSHDAVRDAQKKFGALRLGRSLTPYHELLPAVLGQRVTAIEAMRQWRELVRDYGESAPGPISMLRLPPSPESLRSVPYYTLHKYGIERQRATTLQQVARNGTWLINTDFSAMSASEATTSLQRIQGVGIWTAAVAGGLAFGDPDALQVGDFHVKNTAAWALRRQIRGTDEEMVRDMAPYAGNRHRVMRWLELAGHRAPARGARQRIVSIAHL